jgi:enoyl-CoA hydratase/carnithine racemase
MSLILCERDGAVALVTLNRPDRLNALSTALEEELVTALASAQVREASALIIRGAGERAFSAGADTTELDEATPELALAYYEQTGNVYEQLARLAVPSIAQIHGWCVGGGLEMALACDLRVATESARFWFPEVERGILPSSGGTARAVRALGPAVARRLILLGEKIDARQALALGLIHEVVPDGEVAATALAWAQTLAARPRRAIQVARQAIDAAADGSHAAALAAERLGYAALAGLE